MGGGYKVGRADGALIGAAVDRWSVSGAFPPLGHQLLELDLNVKYRTCTCFSMETIPLDDVERREVMSLEVRWTHNNGLSVS